MSEPRQAPDERRERLATLLEGTGFLLVAFGFVLRVLAGGVLLSLSRPSHNLIIDSAGTFAALCLCAAGLFRERSRVPVGPVLCLVGLGLWGLLSVTWSANRSVAFYESFSLLQAGALLFAALSVTRMPEGRRFLWALLLGVSGLLGAMGFWELWIEIPATRSAFEANPSGVLATIPRELWGDFQARLYAGEVSGPFVISNLYGIACALLLPVAAGFVLRLRQGPFRIGAGLLWGGLLVGGLILSGGKGAWVALAVGVYVILLGRYWSRLNRTLRWVGAIGPVLVAVIGLGVFLALPRETRERVPGGLSAQVRVEYARAAIGMVATHPLLGVGLQNYRAHYSEHRPPSAEETKFAHNVPAQILAELGPIGLLLFAGFWILVIRSLRKPSPADPPDRDGARAPPPAWLAGVGIGLAVGTHLFLGERYTTTLALVTCLGTGLLFFWLAQHLIGTEDDLPRWPFWGAAVIFFTAGLSDFVLFSHGLHAMVLLCVALALPESKTPFPRAGRLAFVIGFVLLLAALSGSIIPRTLRADQARLDAESALGLATNPDMPDEKVIQLLQDLVLPALNEARAASPVANPVLAWRAAQAHEILARRTGKAKHLRAAQEACRWGLSIHPRSAGLQMRDAELTEQLDGLKAAIPRYRRALSLSPHHPRYLARAGVAMARFAIREKDEELAAEATRLLKHGLETNDVTRNQRNRLSDEQTGEVRSWIARLAAL